MAADGLVNRGNILKEIGRVSEAIQDYIRAVTLWSQLIDLPFSLYSTFVIEARHGFNKVCVNLFDSFC